VEVATGRSVLGDDGLIGADVFRHFLVDVDMPKEKLKLSLLPPFPDDPVAATSLDTKSVGVRHFRDRYVPREMKDHTKIFLIGHDMLIPTRVNDSAAKLFLIDTGSFDDTLSPAAAKEVTKLSRDENTQVKGLNGSGKKCIGRVMRSCSFRVFIRRGRTWLRLTRPASATRMARKFRECWDSRCCSCWIGRLIAGMGWWISGMEENAFIEVEGTEGRWG
jgi:hypothetical protein